MFLFIICQGDSIVVFSHQEDGAIFCFSLYHENRVLCFDDGVISSG